MKSNLNKKIGATLLTAAVMTGTFVIPISKAADTTTTPSVSYQAHVQDIGWQKPTSNGIAGTTGRSLRMEAIRMHLENCKDVSLSFDAHIQDIGWKNNLKESDLIGTEGQSKRLEAIRIRANGLAEQGYKLQYRVHVQDIGWQNWKNEGEIAGTEGQSKRAEAIEVRIVEDLATIKESAIAKVSEVLENLDQYSADNQNTIKAIVEEAKKAINDAKSKDAINKVVADTETKVSEVKTIEQEAIETAKETAKATLADYDVALSTVLDEEASAEMSEKIAKAMEDIANAETAEAVKEIFDAIVAEIKAEYATIEDLAEEIATARDEAKQLALANLEKYEQLASTVDGLTEYDLGIITTLIDNAKEAVNNAKTADEVEAAEDDFEALMTNYPALTQKVTATDALVDAQKAVKDEIDAYLDVLKDDNTLGNNKEIVKDRLDMIKEDVMNAKTATEVQDAKDALDAFMTEYANLKQTVATKLLQNAINEAVKTLTPYLSFKDDKDVDPDTGLGEIGTEANDYIEAVKALANDPTKTPDDVTDILVVKNAQGEVTGGAIKTLDDMVAARKQELKDAKDLYEAAKKSAMEELDEYATNATELLSGTALKNVESLIANTKGNISNTADATKVTEYMELFRDSIKTYSSDLAEYGVEEARKSAVATLKAYEEDERFEAIASAARTEIEAKVNGEYTMTDANEIKQTLKEAEDAIADIINAEEIATAVKEESKKFQAYLNADVYSADVRASASTALATINSTDFENAKAVATKSKQLMADIEAILKEEGTSSQEALDNAKKPVSDKLTEYIEIATKTKGIDARIKTALNNYKSQLTSATTIATVNEIEEKLDAYIVGTVIKEKLDKIDELAEIDLTAYTNVTIETPAIVEELNVQVENIKKATQKDLTKVVADATKAITDLAAKIDTLEAKRATTITALNTEYGATGTAGQETVTDKGLNALYQDYKQQINAVKLADYVVNTTTKKDNFDIILENAKNAKDAYVTPGATTPTITGITVTKAPTVTYTKDDASVTAWDLTGGEITVTYSDKSTKVVDMTDSKVSATTPFANSTAGKVTVTVSYEGQTGTYEATITE